MSRRAVITGIGVVAPGGVGREAFWELLSEGRTATRRISLFDIGPFRSQVGAEVDFDPIAAGLQPRQVRRMDRAAQFAVVSAREAFTTHDISSPFGVSHVMVSIAMRPACTDPSCSASRRVSSSPVR